MAKIDRCECGRFMGRDVFRVTLDSDHQVCHRCWRSEQLSNLIGPDGIRAKVWDVFGTIRQAFPIDRRWWKLSFRLTVATG